jgi:hypothetical protein
MSARRIQYPQKHVVAISMTRADGDYEVRFADGTAIDVIVN